MEYLYLKFTLVCKLLLDPIPQFVENNLTQLEAMSSGVMVDTWISPERNQPEALISANNILAHEDGNNTLVIGDYSSRSFAGLGD